MSLMCESSLCRHIVHDCQEVNFIRESVCLQRRARSRVSDDHRILGLSFSPSPTTCHFWPP